MGAYKERGALVVDGHNVIEWPENPYSAFSSDVYRFLGLAMKKLEEEFGFEAVLNFIFLDRYNPHIMRQARAMGFELGGVSDAYTDADSLIKRKVRKLSTGHTKIGSVCVASGDGDLVCGCVAHILEGGKTPYVVSLESRFSKKILGSGANVALISEDEIRLFDQMMCKSYGDGSGGEAFNPVITADVARSISVEAPPYEAPGLILNP